MNINFSQFEKKIGYTFKNRDLLIQALTHSSYAYERQEKDISDNEVLEFLGDSVLGLIIADFLCSSYTELTEGELSKLKSMAESTSGLYFFAKKIKLDKNILLGKGEEKSGGRKKKTILAGAFEALVAAIFLDGSFENACEFFIGHLQSFFKKIKVDKFIIDNYKSALQENLQRDNLPAPVYKTVIVKGPSHRKIFVVEVLSQGKTLGKAKAPSKKSAEQKAAQKALKSRLGRKIKVFTSDTFLLRKKSD